MGRTNPTYRDWLERTESAYRPFRRALRRQDKPHFDRVFERANEFADAAGYANRTTPEHAFFLSLLVAQERELHDLERRLDRALGSTHDTEAPDGQVDG